MELVSNNKTVIIVAGPTAVGKTAVAIELASHFHTEILSADSRQCYKELKIGVARPTEQQLAKIPHHFIASHSIHEEVTAADFEKFALDKLDELFRSHDQVIMTGGTGLYIKAFCEGLDEIPEVNESIRNKIIQNYEKKGLSWLQDEIREKDPGFFEMGEIKNPQRMMRALEVFEATGKSIFDFRKGNKVKRDFNIIKIGLELPKEVLHENISARVDKMMEQGLLEEARSLLPFKELNALETVGYKELFAHLEPEPRLDPEKFRFTGSSISLENAIDLIKQHTRQYAKRQLTWFKKDLGYKWFHPSDLRDMLGYINTGLVIQRD